MKLKKPDVAKFSLGGQIFYIAQKKTPLASLDLLAQASCANLWPKFYFHHRDREDASLSLGALAYFNETPQIEYLEQCVGEKFELRLYGGTSFASTSSKLNSFDKLPNTYFFLPKYTFYEDSKETVLLETFISKRPFENFEFSYPSLDQKSLKPVSQVQAKLKKTLPDFKHWEIAVEQVIREIKDHKLEKVVLARQLSFELGESTCAFQFLKSLQSAFENSSYFCFEYNSKASFLGISPEILYTKNDDELLTEALAGTALNTRDPDLIQSEKELSEVQYVSDFFIDRLSAISTSVKQLKQCERSIGYIKHLHSPFKATLKSNLCHREIIKTLFPSPALCGSPQKEAMQFINKIEPFERGWYTCPLGWISDCGAKMIIAIRCCLIEEKLLHLYVGNGIVLNSDAAQEWNELNLKQKPFFELLNYESEELFSQNCN